MRTAIMSVVALLVGLVAGIALFDRGPGVEYAAIALALTCAVAAAFADSQLRGGTGRS